MSDHEEETKPKGWWRCLPGARHFYPQARGQQDSEKNLLSPQPLPSPRPDTTEEQETDAPVFPVEARWDQLADLYPFLVAKSSFECQVSEDYRHLFFLLRNLEAAEIGEEGKIPAICLGERQIVEAIAVLQKMLATMRQGQVDLDWSQQVLSLFFPDTTPDTPRPQTDSLFLDFDEVSGSDDENEDDDDLWEEDEEGNDFTTDEGHGYSSYS